MKMACCVALIAGHARHGLDPTKRIRRKNMSSEILLSVMDCRRVNYDCIGHWYFCVHYYGVGRAVVVVVLCCPKMRESRSSNVDRKNEDETRRADTSLVLYRFGSGI